MFIFGTLIVFGVYTTACTSDHQLHLGVKEQGQIHLKVSEYEQEIPQSQTADQPMAEEQPKNSNSQKTSGRQLKQSNQLSLPRQDDCKTRKDDK